MRDRANVEIKKDEDVERVRRAHLNDLENIPAFLIAGLFFVCSEPNVDLALWLFRIAFLARVGHTIVSCLLIHNFKLRMQQYFYRFVFSCCTYPGLCRLSDSSASPRNLLHDLPPDYIIHDSGFDCGILQNLNY